MADIITKLSILTENDNLDIEMVKQLISFTPFDCWRKGEPSRVDKRLLKKESCWKIEFYKQTDDIEDCIDVLSKFIDDYHEALKKLHFDYGFVIFIKFVITIHSFYSPIIAMSPSFIKKLADVGGEFHISLYYDDGEDE